ncbi:MAG TPA: CPBP family intramembrane glutamic endopeptidase [Longimicrobiales bacterium]
MPTSLPHHLLVLFLIFVFPLWDRRETRLLKADPSGRRRIRSYQKTVGWLWAATVLLLVTTPLPALLAPPEVSWLAGRARLPILVALCVGLAGGIALPALIALRDDAARAGQRRHLSHIAFFLPVSRTERRWFAAVCVSAGICEELIFRGFLIRYLEAVVPGLGWIGAILAAALVFGVDHGYQGWKGILQTTFLALVFTLLFVLAGNLWGPMIAHALLDLRLLLILEPGVPISSAPAAG